MYSSLNALRVLHFSAIHYPLPSLLQAVHAGEFKPSVCTWTLMTRAELLPPFGEFYEEIARVNTLMTKQPQKHTDIRYIQP